MATSRLVIHKMKLNNYIIYFSVLKNIIQFFKRDKNALDY